MKTKRILTSVVTAALLTGSLAFAGPRHDQSSSTTTRVKKANATAMTTTRTGGNTAIRTRSSATTGNTTFRTRNFASGGNTVSTGTVRNRTVYTNGTRYSSSYPYRTYRSSSYGYPYYGYNNGPSVSFGFGYPNYGYGYYPYDYYGYDSYPYSYNYGAYYYNEPGSTYGNGSIVIQVQARLARAGYYRGPIDGIMGPGTSYAIRAYERDHGLRMDGVISGTLIRSMGLRY